MKKVRSAVLASMMMAILLTTGCLGPDLREVPREAEEQKDEAPDWYTMGAAMRTSYFPVSVLIFDSMCGYSSFNITVWLDNNTLMNWTYEGDTTHNCHQMRYADWTPVLKGGNHTIRAEDEVSHLTNDTAFELAGRLYIAVDFYNPDEDDHPEVAPGLYIFFSDEPFGWD